MYKKQKLTPAQKKFAKVYAQTDNGTEAVRQAYPDLASKTTQPSLSVKAHRMLRNDNVLNEIEAQKAEMARISAVATRRIADLVESEDEAIALNASKFAYEQVHGKATVKVEQRSQHVSVVYNLGGESAPPIPEDIQKKINENTQ